MPSGQPTFLSDDVNKDINHDERPCPADSSAVGRGQEAMRMKSFTEVLYSKPSY